MNPRTHSKVFTALCSALFPVLAAGCSGSASVQLQLHNATSKPGTPSRGQLTAAAALPTELAMRLTAVYVTEDIDPLTQNNVGNTSMIWLNPECQSDIEHCYPDGEPGAGPRIKSYFDFAAGSDAVNKVLNAQAQPVDAGTYRYVRIEFCKMAPGASLAQPNVEWSIAGLAAPRRYTQNTCGVTSQPFAVPLKLGAGDTVTVALAYDLALSSATAADTQPSGPGCIGGQDQNSCYQDCVQTGGSRTCVRTPVFTPSVAVAWRADGGTN